MILSVIVQALVIVIGVMGLAVAGFLLKLAFDYYRWKSDVLSEQIKKLESGEDVDIFSLWYPHGPFPRYVPPKVPETPPITPIRRVRLQHGVNFGGWMNGDR